MKEKKFSNKISELFHLNRNDTNEQQITNIETKNYLNEDYLNYYRELEFQNKYPNAFVFEGRIYNSDLNQYVPSKIDDLPNVANLKIVAAQKQEIKNIKRTNFLDQK